MRNVGVVGNAGQSRGSSLVCFIQYMNVMWSTQMWYNTRLLCYMHGLLELQI